MNSPIPSLKNALQNIPDPRSKQGVSHPFHGILALVILGLTARQIYMTHIVEWAKHYWHELKPLCIISIYRQGMLTIL